MTLKPVDVSLCIVNWNTVKLTLQLIESINITVKGPRIEIIVVDNGSIDGSAEQIARDYPDVSIIRNMKNVGYGAALNQALKVSNGRYKMVLNSDVILLEDALENMVAFLDANSDIGAVGPIFLDTDGEVTYSCGYFPRPWLMILEELFGSLTPGFMMPPPIEMKPTIKMGEKIEVEYIKGACILVRGEVCEEIGLFDEKFFAYYEETDWCFRMKKRGIKRYLIGDAKIIHIYNASFGKLREEARKYFESSKKIYIEKHYGRALAKVFGWVKALSNVRHKYKTALFCMIEKWL